MITKEDLSNIAHNVIRRYGIGKYLDPSYVSGFENIVEELRRHLSYVNRPMFEVSKLIDLMSADYDIIKKLSITKEDAKKELKIFEKELDQMRETLPKCKAAFEQLDDAAFNCAESLGRLQSALRDT